METRKQQALSQAIPEVEAIRTVAAVPVHSVVVASPPPTAEEVVVVNASTTDAATPAHEPSERYLDRGGLRTAGLYSEWAETLYIEILAQRRK